MKDTIMDKKNSKLLIVDSFALIFRSYFALEKLQMRSSKTQEPTWAVYGYFKTLFSVIDELKPNYVIAAWDARGKTFRDDIDAQYKKNRPPAPDDLPSQINKVAEICSNITGVNLNPIYKKDRPKEVKHATCSADKARKLLNYKTTVKLFEGINNTFEYIKMRGVKPFDYHINIEIDNELTPSTWKNKEI